MVEMKSFFPVPQHLGRDLRPLDDALQDEVELLGPEPPRVIMRHLLDQLSRKFLDVRHVQVLVIAGLEHKEGILLSLEKVNPLLECRKLVSLRVLNADLPGLVSSLFPIKLQLLGKRGLADHLDRFFELVRHRAEHGRA